MSIRFEEPMEALREILARHSEVTAVFPTMFNSLRYHMLPVRLHTYSIDDSDRMFLKSPCECVACILHLGRRQNLVSVLNYDVIKS